MENRQKPQPNGEEYLHKKIIKRNERRIRSYDQWTQIETKVKQLEKDLEKNHIEPITKQQLNIARAKQRKKATRPDQVPNEAFIEADIKTKDIYRQALNNLMITQTIPEEWQEGKILWLFI